MDLSGFLVGTHILLSGKGSVPVGSQIPGVAELATLEHAPSVGSGGFSENDIREIEYDVGHYQFDLYSIDREIQSTIAKSGRQVLDYLNGALASLEQLCGYVLSDFDRLKHDDTAKQYYSKYTSLFESCEQAAEHGSKTLDALSTQVSITKAN